MLYCLTEKFVYCPFTRSLNPFYALDKRFKKNLYLFNVLEKMFKQLAYLFLHDVLDYTLQYLSPSSHHTEQHGLKFPKKYSMAKHFATGSFIVYCSCVQCWVGEVLQQFVLCEECEQSFALPSKLLKVYPEDLGSPML